MGPHLHNDTLHLTEDCPYHHPPSRCLPPYPTSSGRGQFFGPYPAQPSQRDPAFMRMCVCTCVCVPACIAFLLGLSWASAVPKRAVPKRSRCCSPNTNLYTVRLIISFFMFPLILSSHFTFVVSIDWDSSSASPFVHAGLLSFPYLAQYRVMLSFGITRYTNVPWVSL
ncbi:hypothetical protein B0I35DRAFT_213769 [Stachybotrys elegans]|uniref:Uncharacterized protein n=1 Tax=Stachybotrys elegans TaxID=80388 RepID=A0A8K0WT12_9HYPO|nr:hypothetical protein B0I35DRAFT_213769 [Stachybotrys elegans]